MQGTVIFPKIVLSDKTAHWCVERGDEIIPRDEIMLNPAPKSIVEGKASWFPVSHDMVEFSIDSVPDGEMVNFVIITDEQLHVMRKFKTNTTRRVHLTEKTFSSRRTKALRDS